MSLTTSVVICAYTEDRWDQLLAAVASVRAQQHPVEEIVVVIDHHDRLLTRASRTLTDSRVVPSSLPPGLSGARNTGIATSSGDVVIFLDDDAVAAPDWTAHLVAPYADPQVLGVGGAAVPDWEGPPPAWFPPEFAWVVGCSYRGQPTSLAPVRNLMGCNMSLRRTVLESVGGFDIGLGRTADRPLGCEETELCIRAAELHPGGRFLLEPRAVVHHRVPRQRASWSYFSARCRAEGVSKARVAGTVGRSAALSSETRYVRTVLPSGIARDLRAGLHGDLAAAARAGAITAGFALTAVGYLAIRWRPTLAMRTPIPARSEPVMPLVLDLSERLAPIDARRPGGPPYRTAACLLTRHGDPVANVRLDLADGLLSAEQVADRLTAAVGVGSLDEEGGGRAAAPVTHRAAATVVVATRDRTDDLRTCLGSILAGSRVPDRLVVVDNAPSSTESADLVADLARDEPRLSYVREDAPGLARAHNAALPYVDTPIVAFTDDDVVVDRRWLERLVDAFGDDERVGCVTGMIAPRELETLPQQWVEGNLTYDKGLRRRVFDTDDNRPDDPLFPVTAGAFGSGANMAFRTDYLRGAGGFDPALGAGTVAMGGDDLAAFYDVITDGRRLVYEPAAIVLHRHHRDYVALRRQTYGYGAGLGAHLTRCLVRDPRTGLLLLRRAPAARRRAARILAPPPITGLPPLPRDLTWQQWRGLLSGPGRYLRSRRRLRTGAAA